MKKYNLEVILCFQYFLLFQSVAAEQSDENLSWRHVTILMRFLWAFRPFFRNYDKRLKRNELKLSSLCLCEIMINLMYKTSRLVVSLIQNNPSQNRYVLPLGDKRPSHISGGNVKLAKTLVVFP